MSIYNRKHSYYDFAMRAYLRGTFGMIGVRPSIQDPALGIWDSHEPQPALPKASAWTASPLQIITLIPRTMKSEGTRMTEATQTTPATSAAEEPIAAPENPAVARCMKVWDRVIQEEMANGKSKFCASVEARQPYRDAMPSLFGYENICNFIACVVRGMLIGAIAGEDSTRLLYAAQVALATVPRQPAAPRLVAK
jgi:hypothetical protein